MGRPAKFDRAEAVQQVMNEIWRNGYEASSVKALSEMLGITRSSFYNAFGSRAALFREALELYFSQSPDRALALAEPGVPIKALFTRTFREVCRARAADPQGRGCLAVNSVAELCNGPTELGETVASAVLGSLARIKTLLAWGVDQGELDTDTDLKATALALQNLLIGLNVMCKVVRAEADLWLTAKTTLKGLNLFDEGA